MPYTLLKMLLADFCESNPCQNGDCSVVSGGFKCTCYDGFTGTTCDIVVQQPLEMNAQSMNEEPVKAPPKGGTCTTSPDTGRYIKPIMKTGLGNVYFHKQLSSSQ